MCNCIKEVEERLLKGCKADENFKQLTVNRVRLNGVAIMFNGGDQMSGTAMILHEPNGKGKRTSREINIAFKYCPFCGEKYGKTD